MMKWFQPNFFGEMCYLGESYKQMQSIQLWKFWKRPPYEISEYAFKFFKQFAPGRLLFFKIVLIILRYCTKHAGLECSSSFIKSLSRLKKDKFTVTEVHRTYSNSEPVPVIEFKMHKFGEN